MDALLGKVTSQAMNYAIRSGITITATYAFKQCGRLLKETPRSEQREELMQLQLRLESKIRIISPSIDMIDLISARGNTTLESAVSWTKEIRYEIQKLGSRLSEAANEEELLRHRSSRAKPREQVERELRIIINSIKTLLSRIEDAVPLINLAITTSGVNLSTKLSGTISPSRLLQASTFLTAADSKYATQPGRRVQVGPTWTLSMYMLFAGHAWRPVDEDGVRETTWKEVVHKTRVKLMRVSLEELYLLPGEQKPTANGSAGDSIPGEAKAAEFAYQLVMIEDLDDDRVHTFEDDEAQPGPFDDVTTAGIRDVVPIHEISKVFYADTGKILNIGGDSETNSPVLLLRRDVHAEPPRRMLHRSQMGNQEYYDESEIHVNGAGDHEQSEIDAQIQRESAPNTPLRGQPNRTNTAPSSRWRLPADLDPEWIAFEVYTEEPDSDVSDPEENANAAESSSRPASSREDSLGPSFTSALSKMTLKSPSNSPSTHKDNQLVPSRNPGTSVSPSKRTGPQIKTSLSLLEMLLKLTALQQFRQESHLSIEDELLNFFLEDSATAGAGPDKDARKRVRNQAVRRVGFDPYDESPVKKRGEEYIQGARGAASPRMQFEALPYGGELDYGDVNGYDLGPEEVGGGTPDFIRPTIERPSRSPHSPMRGYPSSPSPRPALEPTPSLLTSSPPAANPPYRNPVREVHSVTAAGMSSKASLFPATPQSEPKVRSPLRELVTKEGDEGIGTSPASVDLDKDGAEGE